MSSAIQIPAGSPKPTTSRRAITARCIYCVGSRKLTRECDAYDCSLYPYLPRNTSQNGENGLGVDSDSRGALKTENVVVPRSDNSQQRYLLAIRKHCLWCCGNSATEVDLCTEPVCPSYNWLSQEAYERKLRYDRQYRESRQK